MVEFAIVCPVLLLLALACADFGRVAHFYEVVANAARTGAESGATQQFTDFTRSNWEANIESAVLAELQNVPGFDQTKLSYELTTSVDADGIVHLAVDVSYPFETTISWPGLPAETTLRKRVEFRQFR